MLTQYFTGQNPLNFLPPLTPTLLTHFKINFHATTFTFKVTPCFLHERFQQTCKVFYRPSTSMTHEHITPLLFFYQEVNILLACRACTATMPSYCKDRSILP